MHNKIHRLIPTSEKKIRERRKKESKHAKKQGKADADEERTNE
jgi:hypothetical protein